MADKSKSFPDVNELLQRLKSDVFIRIVKEAQRNVLNRWKKKSNGPGLMTRFERQGIGRYNYKGYQKYPSTKRPYYATKDGGSTRAMLLARRPVSAAGKTVARTRLKTGGGNFNFLSSVYPTTYSKGTKTITLERGPYSVGEHTRKTPTGKTTLVDGYTMPSHQVVRVYNTTMATTEGESYTSQFHDFSQDIPWIQREIEKEFMRIVKATGFTKSGKLKKSFGG